MRTLVSVYACDHLQTYRSISFSIPFSLYEITELLIFSWSSFVAQVVRNPPAMKETWVRSLDWEDPLEKEMATQSSILAWKIPWTEESGRLQSVGHKESDTTERPLFFIFYITVPWSCSASLKKMSAVPKIAVRLILAPSLYNRMWIHWSGNYFAWCLSLYDCQ